MPLRPKPVSIPFLQGLAQSVDERLAPAGVLDVAQNVVATKTGRLGKRLGFTARPGTDADDGSDTVYVGRGVHTLSSLRNEQLMITDTGLALERPGKTDFWSWSPEASGWELADTVYTAGAFEREFIDRRAGSVLDTADLCQANGLTMYAVDYAEGDVDLVVLDSETRTILYRWTQSNAQHPHCITVGDYLICLYAWTGTLYALVYDTTHVETGALVWHGITAGAGTDVVACNHPSDSTRFYVCDGGTVYEISTSTWTVVTSVAVSGGGAASGFDMCLSPDDTYLVVSYVQGGNTYVDRITRSTFSITQLALTSGGTAYNPTAIVPWAFATNEVLVYWTRSANPYTAIYVDVLASREVLVSSWATGGSTHRTSGLRLASRAFHIDTENSRHWIYLRHADPLSQQRQLVLACREGYKMEAAGRTEYQTLVGYDNYRIPNVIGDEDTGFETVVGSVYAGDIIGDYRAGAKSIKFEFSNRRLQQAAIDAPTFCGAMPCQYTGDGVQEVGFLFWPEKLNYDASAGATIPAGTYQYQAIYVATDRLGNVTRSAPSNALDVTLGTAKDVTVWVTALPYSWRQSGEESEVSVEIYRTTDGGKLHYLVGTVQNIWENGVTPTATSAVSFLDQTLDPALVSHPVLYTDAGELDEFHPPGSDAITEHGNRLWVADGTRVYFSKEHLQGFAPGFVADMFLETPETVTALGSTEDALAVFSESGAWLIWGDGPDRTGGNGTFNPPRRVPGKYGCPRALGGQRSICKIDSGLLFRSDQGIALLPFGGGAPQIVSDPIEDLLDLRPIVTSATYLEDEQRVKFTLTWGETRTSPSFIAVWDIKHNLWSIDTAIGNAYALRGGHVWDGRYAYASPPYAATESESNYYDTDEAAATADIPMQITTRPLYPAGRDGEARVYVTAIDGECMEATDLQIETAVNGEALGYTRTPSLTAGEIALEYNNPRQRCNRIVYDFQESSDTQGVELAGLTLYYAPMQRRRRGLGERV